MPKITFTKIPAAQREAHVNALFGYQFPMKIEPLVYYWASRLSPDYRGGYWEFKYLSNEGYFMHPDSQSQFKVISENGFEGQMSSEAFGIVACLFTFSQLAFEEKGLQRFYSMMFHLLRDYALEHPDAGAILAATD